MALFPAYGSGGGGEPHTHEDDSRESGSSGATERRLLASDEEDVGATDVTVAPARAPSDTECYEDARRDPGNLRVSTLYYPGRPEYRERGEGGALGRVPRPSRRRRRRLVRYYHAVPGGEGRAEQGEGRAGAGLRASLAALGTSGELVALEYVRWSREVRGEAAALEAAREAAAACPTRRVLDVLQRARARVLPEGAALAELRGELAAARGEAARLDAWERVIEAAGPAHAVALGGAALDSGPPAWYPRILYAVGWSLCAAGLWERLVLLVELAAAMNFPGGAGFPPAVDATRTAAVERDLADKEEKVTGSGLPRGTVWARVERLRAEARWRAGAGGQEDPQRRPLAPELAPCLRAAPPAAAPALLAALLRLARIPPLPASDAVWRALPGEPESGEALAAVLRAARRLPLAHAARPRPDTEPPLRATLASLLDPPHYFSDSTGYLSWVSALWEAACEWAGGGEPRAALVCWRLRWLHALAERALHAEARRLRAEGRAVVRRWAARDARAHALLARLDPEQGARVALRAVRAALAARAPPHHALYAARVAGELEARARGARGEGPALHALVAAVLQRPLPDETTLAASSPPTPPDLAAALHEATRRCADYEREGEEQGEGEEQEQEEGEDVVDALLPSAAGEWVSARVALAAPAERARLERRVAEKARAPAPVAGRAAGARRRYLEHAACALVVHAAAEGRLVAVAAAMLPAFPENALLALACAGAPLWARPAATLAWPEGHAAALARVVPAVLRAPLQGEGAERAARACSRAGAGACGGGATLAGVALAAGAGGARGAERAALGVLATFPHHKWVYVRAATAVPHLAPSLADALLERELRAHALVDELDRLDTTSNT